MMKWICFLLLATSVWGQVDIRKNFIKKSIAVTGEAAVVEVLKNDLRLSGAFEVKSADEAELLAQVTAGSCLVIQTATKTSLMSKAYQTAGTRALAHAMADDIVLTVTGQRGIAQTRIAFIYSRKPGVKELAVMDYDGHNIRVVTSDGKISGHPRWSPDGQKIAYTSYWKYYPDVLEANLETKERRVLANFKGVNTGADYTPDGGTLALTLSKDGNPELYTASASGGRFRRLTNTDSIESSPVWSPDGESIAYVSNASGTPQIWLIGRNGGEPRRLTVSPSHNTEPAWSRPPAGSDMKSMIAVTSMVGGRFQIGIYDGNQMVTPVVADGADNADPTWAPNGRHLVFAKTRNFRSRLYLLDVRTKEQLELPAIEGDASEPAWGPWR
ncbi:MAG: Protein TolB [Verrucomicrobiae bacterium]|nr:Protein TolB [Verrucomicrobiae bacterium]